MRNSNLIKVRNINPLQSIEHRFSKFERHHITSNSQLSSLRVSKKSEINK